MIYFTIQNRWKKIIYRILKLLIPLIRYKIDPFLKDVLPPVCLKNASHSLSIFLYEVLLGVNNSNEKKEWMAWRWRVFQN